MKLAAANLETAKSYVNRVGGYNLNVNRKPAPRMNVGDWLKSGVDSICPRLDLLNYNMCRQTVERPYHTQT